MGRQPLFFSMEMSHAPYWCAHRAFFNACWLCGSMYSYCAMTKMVARPDLALYVSRGKTIAAKQCLVCFLSVPCYCWTASFLTCRGNTCVSVFPRSILNVFRHIMPLTSTLICIIFHLLAPFTFTFPVFFWLKSHSSALLHSHFFFSFLFTCSRYSLR